MAMGRVTGAESWRRHGHLRQTRHIKTSIDAAAARGWGGYVTSELAKPGAAFRKDQLRCNLANSGES